MELIDFLRQIHAEIRERINSPDCPSPYDELVFTEIITQHMAEIGMTFESVVICPHEGRVKNAIVRMSGYSLSEDNQQFDLFINLYSGTDELKSVSEKDIVTAAEQCWRFLKGSADGSLLKALDDASDAYMLATTIKECYKDLDQIRIYVLTDQQAKVKHFNPRDMGGKLVKLEVMDIERLHNHLLEGKPRDEVTINFKELVGSALPCIHIPGEVSDYDYALTVIPGEVLHFAYEKYGARILEANVRSFLSTTGKVNRGIRDTLQNNPEHFLAYNNGIVILADEIRLERTENNFPGLSWMKGMQIVNGGQTTASIYFTKRKFPHVDLKPVRVPAKIIVLRSGDPETEETMIAAVSQYANSQNVVRQADLSANKHFHVAIEKLSNSTYCPDGRGRWFYERATGSYNTLLTREGKTQAQLRRIKDIVPSSRKITKTDLAKFLNAWNQKPHLVSLGAQKNFDEFMNEVNGGKGPFPEEPDVAFYKNMIAKAILFKAVQKLVRPAFRAFQANITVYLVSLISYRLGNDINLDRIWQRQDLSYLFKQQISKWAPEVHQILHQSANGRMISEWAKKPECWNAVRKGSYSPVINNIQEMNISPEARPQT